MPEPDASKALVYIGYAREDQAFAGEIFASLRSRGFAVWMDRPPEAFQLEGILPGQDTALQIEQHIGEACVLLLLLSPRSIAQQGYIQTEFRLALHAAARRRLRVIPLLQGPSDLPAFAAGSIALDALDWIDFAKHGLDAVVAAIAQNSPRSANVRPARRAAGLGAISQPRIRWRATLGRLHWRNTIAAENGRLYVTSCGAHWNQDDRGDGIYCLDAQSGAPIWTFTSAGDANEAFIYNGRIIFGTDAGQLVLIDKNTGDLIREARVWHPIFARPFALSSKDGDHVFAISQQGVILAINTRNDTISQVGNLPFPLRANPAVSADRRTAILFGETGEIARAWAEGDSLRWETLAVKSYRAAGASSRRHAGLVAAPMLDGEYVIGGAIRDSYYGVPALFRFDFTRSSFVWGEHEEEPRAGENSFGNLRSQPLMMGDDIIFAPAYAAALFAADRKTGEIRWKLPVGKELLQQWSSLVKVDDRRVLLARADGILYQVDIVARKIEWAMSVLVPPGVMRAAARTGQRGPGNSEAAHNGITATPVWQDGNILIGTTEGQLFCITDADDLN